MKSHILQAKEAGDRNSRFTRFSLNMVRVGNMGYFVQANVLWTQESIVPMFSGKLKSEIQKIPSRSLIKTKYF